jgi:two-component system sensor histidine kinase AlgZ
MQMKNSDSLKPELVIPDCCNVGVVIRVLAAVNVVALFTLLGNSVSIVQTLMRLVEVSFLLELICLLSLFLLCLIRRALFTISIATWLQRSLCAFTPACVAYFVVLFLNVLMPDGESLHIGWQNVCLISALFGLCFQHYFELRTRAYSPALGEAKLQALQARIRPHFLFNSLNAVLSLIRKNPQRAETALEDLADLFRVFMRDARDMTMLSEEIDLCKKYLAIEELRLGERLQVQWRIEKLDELELKRIHLPSLLLQPLVENAVHYGVEPAVQSALIEIVIRRQLDKLEILITNPYLGMDFQSTLPLGNHMALENIQQRLDLVYDVEAQFQTRIEGNQFVVQLRIPYQ